MVVGLLNLAIGVLALTTGFVRISTGATGGFLAVGLVMLAVAALVWRGNRATTIGAFALFLSLLLLQIGQILTDPDAGDAAAAAASGDQPVGRLLVLAALTATCGIAAWRRRRSSSRPAD